MEETKMTRLLQKTIIRVSGEQAFDFLQGQLTCDLRCDRAVHVGAHCNLKGRVVSLFDVLHTDDGYYLITESSQVKFALKKLQRYLLNMKCTLEILETPVYGVEDELQKEIAPYHIAKEGSTLIARLTDSPAMYYVIGNPEDLYRYLNLDIPDSNAAIPTPQNESPALEKDIPVPQNESPVLEKDTPVPQNESPALEKDIPVPQNESPVLEKDTPVPQNESPVLEKGIPTPQNESPVLEKDTPVPQNESPVLEKDIPTPQNESPPPACGGRAREGGNTSASQWLTARLKHTHLPWLTKESRGEFLPAELGLERHDAVSLDKGCFVGQEIVARMHYLGKMKKHAELLELPEYMPPCSFLPDKKGQVICCSEQPPFTALCVVKK